MADYLQRIRALRKERKMSQTTLAQMLGMSQKGYSSYETGYRAMPIEVLLQLCDFYNVSADYLLGRSDKRE